MNDLRNVAIVEVEYIEETRLYIVLLVLARKGHITPHVSGGIDAEGSYAFAAEDAQVVLLAAALCLGFDVFGKLICQEKVKHLLL